MAVNAVIVTSCTHRKSDQGRADLAQLPRTQSVRALADRWRQRVGLEVPQGPAGSLYRGRSIADVTAAAAHLGSPWYVVSAGLGLVRADEPVAAYECTVASRSELARRLERLEATPADWWGALTVPHPLPLSRLIAQGPTLLALPGSYLGMVVEDLARVSNAQAKHLRIFTSPAGAQVVPGHLVQCVMPYDDRMESVHGHAGTQSDFAQRALRHFVMALNATSFSLDDARSAVDAALAERPRRPRSMGTRTSDDEIRRVLALAWERHSGRSTQLLRYLRDDVRISCEQKRFSKIWQALAAELRA